MSLRKVLIVPDTHAPYHDERAWQLMMDAAVDWGPDTIVHMGDLWDAYEISAHAKDPLRAYNLDDELEVTRQKRAELDQLGASRKEFIEGNHEFRLTSYLQNKAPELFGITDVSRLLELREHDWRFTKYRDHTKIGKVYFTHDTGNSGKFTTSSAMDSFQHSVVIGHHHALQYHVRGDATGQLQVGAQFGWLGDIEKADYMHRIKALRNWTLAFGIGYHNPDSGIVHLVPVPIVDYKCCIEGKVFS